MKITNAKDLALHVTGESDINRVGRAIYKGTDCGAWIEITDIDVLVGSIVEGSDIGTATYRLKYPFESDGLWKRLEAIEAEAEKIWEWANEPGPDGETSASHGIDCPDVS